MSNLKTSVQLTNKYFVKRTDFLHIPLGAKSLQQITSKFQQNLNSLEVFRTIFAQQIVYNVKMPHGDPE